MSEQYPLLCEDLSDEDTFTPRFHRRRTLIRGRARNHLKGAAAIMTRWPEHWTSILTYWWIGLGMIALITFVIYNTLFAIVLLQPANARPIKYAELKTSTHVLKPTSLPSVFMHVFANSKEEEDLNKYIPYIEVFANKYKGFMYNLIVVSNDTYKETNNLTDESTNEIALNSLWTNDVNYGNLMSSNSNINVKYVTLTNYLNDSPIKEHWNNLPQQFIQFLVRAIAVWDKGGIAINPIILTPSSPYTSYVEKFVTIIKQFKKNNKPAVTEQQHEIPVKKNYKIPSKVNNIRDIIDAIERGEGSDGFDKEILHAAESKNDLVLINKENQRMSALRQEIVADKHSKPLINTKIQHSGNFIDSIIVVNTTETSNQTKETTNNEYKIDSPSKLLPLFLNYLFRSKETKSYNDTTHSMKKRRSPKITEITKDVDSNGIETRHFWYDTKSTDNYKPMIVSAKGIPHNSAANNIKSPYQDDEKLFELTVDLKGNIIATQTPCHAFIGTMFTNVMHHDETESLTDFIIKELSVFCKGLLASCMGIDVILV